MIDYHGEKARIMERIEDAIIGGVLAYRVGDHDRLTWCDREHQEAVDELVKLVDDWFTS